ncbi:MAG: glycosyltransferase, partial [Myxococcota bacterium]|nr:glycosyltransferase [Myxococcota bacterium]
PGTSAGDRPNVLLLLAYYFPGYKAGGPARSISNMVQMLGGEFEFRIVTSDRDLGDGRPYLGVVAGRWTPVDKAWVLYLPPGARSLPMYINVLRNTPHDILYLNSFFARRYSMLPVVLRRLGLIPRLPLLLAPRGEFSPGALQIKGRRKQTYIRLVRALRLYDDVTWHASSALEEHDIMHVMTSWAMVRVAAPLPAGPKSLPQPRNGGLPLIHVAPDLLAVNNGEGRGLLRGTKVAGRLSVVCVSRISRMKNLDGSLTLLHGLRGAVRFVIWGPKEDLDYWRECEELIGQLPPNVEVTYKGPVPHEEVARVFAAHDIFLLPTRGENFGHVIVEALGAGCPVVISDRTPWRNLEQHGVGWDISLERPARFREVLQACVDMGPEQHAALSQRAREFAVACSQNPQAVEANRRLLLGMKNAGSSSKVGPGDPGVKPQI